MSLDRLSEQFALEAIEANRVKAVVEIWERYSEIVNKKKAYKTKDGRWRSYSLHTIVKFTTMCRNAVLNHGKKYKRLTSKILTKEGLRIEKKIVDNQSRSIYTEAQIKIKINKPKELIDKALDNVLNAWNIHEIIAALGLLTGRRSSEVVYIAAHQTYQFIDDNHIHVKGLMKKGVHEATIPVFGGAANVIKGFKNLANYLKDDTVKLKKEEIKNRHQANTSKEAVKLLDRFLKVEMSKDFKGKKFSISMHTTRKIYTALCIEFVFNKSEILPVSMSKFITTILGHKSKDSDEVYDSIQINKGGYLWK